jgi:site-specific DNA-methyltransferase (adenine-specific)
MDILDKSTSFIVYSDNIKMLQKIPGDSIPLIYIDPPFNTGHVQTRQLQKTVRSTTGTRIGFKDATYEVIKTGAFKYNDTFEDFWDFLEPRLLEAWRILTQDGTLYLHLDYHEVHYAKVFLDYLFGRECFLNEIIWAYDYGAKAKRKWPAKHDTILVYVKDPEKYYFDSNTVDREPYMAPGLVTKEKAQKGKLPTDVWWHTIVSPMGMEKTGYPTQKPLGILRRIIQASSKKGDTVLDFFAGSGTTGVAAMQLERRFILIDNNPDAISIMHNRFETEKQLFNQNIMFCSLSDFVEEQKKKVA